jgi:hypothetical protein
VQTVGERRFGWMASPAIAAFGRIGRNANGNA